MPELLFDFTLGMTGIARTVAADHWCTRCRKHWRRCKCADFLMPSGRRASCYDGAEEEYKRRVERAIPFTPKAEQIAREDEAEHK